MSNTYGKVVRLQKLFVYAGFLPVMAGMAVAQDFPKVETSPAFMYIRTAPVFGGSQDFNCAGGGGTIAVNVSSAFGLAADLGSCKAFGLNNTYGVGSKVNGSEFTYLFGPRITFRSKSPFRPFFELSVGGIRVGVSCKNGNAGNACGSVVPTQPLPTSTVVVVNPSATSASVNAFAMSVGGGFDIKVNKKLSFRVVQAEYLYTRFGNDCQFAYCNNNNNQNSSRLKSGIVLAWGGEAPAPAPPAPPPMKSCWNGSSVPVSAACPLRTMTLALTAPQTELCPGATVAVAPSAGMPDGATYQWTVNNEAISKAPSLDFGTTGRQAGTYKIGLTVAADGYEEASAGTAITVRASGPPAGTLEVAPSEIWFGDKAKVGLTASAGQCGGDLRPAVLSASEGTVADGVYDSSTVQFDPSNNAEQRKTVKITAELADQTGSASTQASVVVKKRAMAKRLPDIIFPAGNARINNCGKRVLLEELKPYLDADPTGRVVLLGHVSQKEAGVAGLDQQRALNAAAVISSGQGVCLSFAAAQILIGPAGTADTGADYQSYFCGTSTVPMTTETAASMINASDPDAKYRRVEVWFVPTGSEPPAFLKSYQDAASLAVAGIGCPR